MSQTSQKKNKALVLEAFETLFNKRDYAAAERFWSDHYIQHSAHIAPGVRGCSTSSARCRRRCATRTN
jgi:predicted SnoaL-like aldol condensation-catalyzing enzyme